MNDVPVRTAVCAWCGKEFSWQDVATPFRKYCSSQCGQAALHESYRKYNKKRYAAKVAAEPERVCKVCGKTFKRVSGQSKLYCSAACGFLYLLKKNKRNN